MLLNRKNSLQLNYNVIKFILIGGFNTLVCLALFWLLISCGINYLIASALMNVFGVIEGYTLNAKLLYRTKLEFVMFIKYSNIQTN